jgi:hypothetical protein
MNIWTEGLIILLGTEVRLMVKYEILEIEAYERFIQLTCCGVHLLLLLNS